MARERARSARQLKSTARPVRKKPATVSTRSFEAVQEKIKSNSADIKALLSAYKKLVNHISSMHEEVKQTRNELNNFRQELIEVSTVLGGLTRDFNFRIGDNERRFEPLEEYHALVILANQVRELEIQKFDPSGRREQSSGPLKSVARQVADQTPEFMRPAYGSFESNSR
jgi:chromosome segregation ATPase